MERKLSSEEEEERGEASRISINGKDDNYDEALDNLKKEISRHSMYELMVKSHLDCLKLCLGKIDDDCNGAVDPAATMPFSGHRSLIAEADRSELDQFMEEYCMTLNKVKEVIEAPQQESMEFINHMYSQLQDLLLDLPSSPIPPEVSRER